MPDEIIRRNSVQLDEEDGDRNLFVVTENGVSYHPTGPTYKELDMMAENFVALKNEKEKL